MLILSRKLNESIVIEGRIVIKVLRIEKDTVKLGIQAPADVEVHREEVYQMIQRNRHAGIDNGRTPKPVPPAAEDPHPTE